MNEKEFVLVSQGIEIMRTKSQEKAINYVKKENDDWFDYKQRCIDNYEKYADNYIDLEIEYASEKQKEKEIDRLNNIINELKKDTQNKTKYINYIDDVASKYKSRIDKALSWTNRIIEIIKQQPSEDDTWILENLHSIKCLLQGVIRMNEKYILVGSDKDRYQRPVDIYVVKKFDTLKEASSYLMSYVNKCDEMINAINNKIDYVDIGDIWYELEYIDNYLVSYLQSGDDEYCSSSYKIFKITDQ